MKAKKKTKPKTLSAKPVPLQKPKMGRPSSYTDKTAAKICELIALGKSLITICSASDMPDRVTVYRWLEEHIEFRNEYARARERQADHYADQIVDLADNAEDANLARLQIDARKWTAAKLRPARYSERFLNEHTGKDGSPIAVKQITADMSPQQAADLYAETLLADDN